MYVCVCVCVCLVFLLIGILIFVDYLVPKKYSTDTI